MELIEIFITWVMGIGSAAFIFGIFQALRDGKKKRTRKAQH
jgi:hypothetical protein